ncbi:MAG TPA: T9SS type A sorting domain-containing protein [Bacteroidia bacterium]|nr:T9SS type A sorting domain-containing protein [Bacteroidia bacterium]
MKTTNYKETFRKLIFVLTIISLFVFSGQKTYATHCAGADLQFCWVGPGVNDYMFTYIFYRNCGSPANWTPAPAPGSVTVRIYSASCGMTLTANLLQAPAPNGTEVSLACGSVVTSCNNGTVQGYRRWVYTGLYTLPAQCTDWQFSVDVNARNENITTLNDPGGQSLTVVATLNNILAPIDCSPGFSNPPLAFLCVNQQMTYNHAAIDADGDSLVYTLVGSLQTIVPNNIQPVDYLFPFSATNPISTAPPGIVVNPQTGEVTLTATGNGELGVMAFRVDEYRNGQLIGSVMRDMQVYVIVCTNNVPAASGLNNTTNYSATICPNILSCFTINSSDANLGDTVSMSWNNGIPSASFVVTGSPLPIGTFCWTPTVSDVGLNVFTVQVQDNACPIVGSQTFTYSINVAPLPVIQTTGDQSICAGNSATIGASGAVSYQWSPPDFLNTTSGPSVTSTPLYTQQYTVTGTSAEGCTGTTTVSVIVNPNPILFYPSNPTICSGGSIVINVTGADYYTWTPLTGIINNNPEYSQVTVSLTSTQSYTVVGYTLEGCSASATITVTVNQNPVPVVSSNSPICAGTTLTLSATGGTGYSWTGPNSFTSSSATPSITGATVSASGIYTVVVTDANTCQGTGTVSVTVNANPVPVVSSNSPVCAGSTLTLSASGGTTYSWTGPNSFTSNSANPSIPSSTVAATGIYTVVVGDANNCSTSATFSVTVNANPVPVLGSNSPICDGFTLNLTASGGTTYSWTGPNSFVSAQQNPSIGSASPAATGIYTVDVGDANNCHTISTLSATVNPNPTPVISPLGPTTFCDGGSVLLDGGSYSQYQWNTTPTQATSSITVSETSTFDLQVWDANGCTAVSSPITITVNPNPVPVISPMGPTTFCDGGSVLLDGGAYSQYQWNTTPTQATSSITVSETSTFDLQVWDANGCTGTSAPITITVNPNPVPVITPDGPISFCIGGNVNLDGGTWVAYSWSGLGETTSSINVSQTRTVDVTVTDANGCVGTSAPLTVTVNPLPPAVVTPAGPVLICSNNPATLSANTAPGYTYQWYNNAVEIPGATSSDYIASATGLYSVRIIDANGCTSLSNEVQVIQGVGPVVTIVASPGIGCLLNTIFIGYGPQDITLTAMPPAAAYLWSTGATTQSISVTEQGNYSVIAYDINGCPSPSPGILSPPINIVDIRCGHDLRKIILCHVPEGNFDNPQTICIGEPAIEPHLRLHRWDCLGPCSLYYNRSTVIDVGNFYVIPTPNPFDNAFTLHILTTEYVNAVIVNVFDVTGRLVEHHADVNEQTEIGATLKAGVYIAEVRQGDNRQVLQIVKSK